MAQKITRTINTTVVTCRVLDKHTEEFHNIAVTLPGKVEDEAKQCRACGKESAAQNCVFIKVVDVQFIDSLYEMPLDTFIANATRVTE